MWHKTKIIMSNFIDGFIAAEIEHAKQTRNSKIENEFNKFKQKNSIDSQANEKRREHGAKFERYVDTLLSKSGLGCIKTRIKTSDGVKISDHTFGEVWMESTTFFNKARANEFILKKKLIEEATTKFTKFFLFYEKDVTSVTKTLVDKLESAGWIVISGENEIESCIAAYGKRKKNSSTNIISVATPTLIDIDLLDANPLNREQDKKGIEAIANSIINEGFLTCLYVVPDKDKDGNATGRYMLFEGHHRLSAAKIARSWGFSLDKLPCVIVEWESTANMEKLSKLLIKINVEYRNWKLSDYIRHHLHAAELLLKKDENNQSLINKQYSYQALLNWIKLGKTNNFGDTGLLYILGPVKGSGDKWLNQGIIKDGDYTVTKDEVENYANPFFDLMNLYVGEAKSRDWYRRDVYNLFCCELYQRFKNGNISLDTCDLYFDYYNNLSIKNQETPNKKSDIVDTFKILDVKVDNFMLMIEKRSK